MKITQADLEQAAQEVAKISTGNLQPEQVKVRADPKVSTIHRGDALDIYSPETKQYVQSHGLHIVANTEKALEFRYAGRLAFSPREADTCARKGIDLNSDTNFRGALLHQGLMLLIIEDSLEYRENVFSLREVYNRGIRWRFDLRSQASESDQVVGDKALIDIADKLQNIGLPAWPSELEAGFPVELTKPDYMDWKQYNQLRRFAKPNPKPGDTELTI